MEHRIIFSGEVLPGFEVSAVKQHLTRLMKLTPAQADKLFSGHPIAIKQGLDEIEAVKYLDGMKKIGVVVAVEPPLPSMETTLVLEPLPEQEVDPSAELTQPITPGPETHFPTRSAPATQPSGGAAPNAASSKRTAKQSQAFAYCRSCGKPMAPQAYKCLSCGAVQKKENKSAVAIIIAVVAIILVFVIGILAVIAIPAYQDYVLRAKVSMAMQDSERYRRELEDFVSNNGFLPSSNGELGISDSIQTPNIAALSVGSEGVMTIEMGGHPQLAGQTLVWTPTVVGDVVAWRCEGGSIERRHLPLSCRETTSSSTGQSTVVSSEEKQVSRTVRSSNGLISVALPGSGWSEEMPEGTELAYVHKAQDVGVAVVREPKEEFEIEINLDQYTDLLIEYAFTDFREAEFERYGSYPIQNMPGRLFSFNGYSDSVPIRGLVASVEGQKDFYKVMVWTHRSNFDRNYDTMLGILESFSENP
jgi:type IV pilus assembly protein PilA